MKKTVFYSLVFLLLALTGCKNDDEKDYLVALEQSVYPNKPGDDTPANPVGMLALNELNGNAKFIELFNGGLDRVDIGGITIRKDDSKIIYTAPSGTMIPAKGFLVLYGNAIDWAEGFTSGLSADKATKIQLLDKNGEELDVFKNLPENPGDAWNSPGTYSCKPAQGSFSRFPDGTGRWYVGESTEGSANIKGHTEIIW